MSGVGGFRLPLLLLIFLLWRAHAPTHARLHINSSALGAAITIHPGTVEKNTSLQGGFSLGKKRDIYFLHSHEDRNCYFRAPFLHLSLCSPEYIFLASFFFFPRLLIIFSSLPFFSRDHEIKISL